MGDAEFAECTLVVRADRATANHLVSGNLSFTPAVAVAHDDDAQLLVGQHGQVEVWEVFLVVGRQGHTGSLICPRSPRWSGATSHPR